MQGGVVILEYPLPPLNDIHTLQVSYAYIFLYFSSSLSLFSVICSIFIRYIVLFYIMLTHLLWRLSLLLIEESLSLY